MATHSYGGDPAIDTKDEIRFLINDVDSPWSVSDEEIAFLLTAYPKATNVVNYECAIAACLQLSATYANKVTKSVGSLSLSYSEQQQKYLDLADRYKAAARSGVTGQAPNSAGAPLLFGGGDTFLGPDDSPNYYSK